MTRQLKLWPLLLSILILLAVIVVDDAVAMRPAKGMFLVADENLADPRFNRGVILLIQYDSIGAAGLVVNRSSRLPLDSVLAKSSNLAGDKQTLSYGGPVEPNALLALVQVNSNPPDPAEKVFDKLYVTGVEVLEDWPDFSSEVLAYRAFVGYTGWAPGQLDQEVAKGDWHLVNADVEQIFAVETISLWAQLLEGAARE